MLIGTDLLYVTRVVTFCFPERVASELFQDEAGDGERDHAFGGDAGGGDNADIGALVGGFRLFPALI